VNLTLHAQVLAGSADLQCVATYAVTKDLSFADGCAMLTRLVGTFESHSTGNRTLIHDLLDRNRTLFYSCSMEILKTVGDSRGTEFLVALMVANDLLLQAMCDPALNREQALALGRMALRVDPMAFSGFCSFLCRVATRAPGSSDRAAGKGAVAIEDAPRLMEILGEISDPSRLLPSLMRLLHHPNPHLRSKAVKMIGRNNRSVKWVQERMTEPNARTRANAVETLWGIDTGEVRELLRHAANDTNSRVAGNAMLGLYHLGECSVIPELIKMAGQESSLARLTAAWVMGECADPRFSEALRRMLSLTDAVLRKRAFQSIGRIKAANARAKLGTEVRMDGQAGAELANGMRQVLVRVTSQDGRELPPVLPNQFFLSEAGRHILSYRITGNPRPERYEIEYEPVSADASGVKIRLQTPGGWGRQQSRVSSILPIHGF
jgi:hypothetical protein